MVSRKSVILKVYFSSFFSPGFAPYFRMSDNNVRAGDVCKKTEPGNCQRSRLFFGILSLEKAFEPGFWSEITITDLLKAKMAAH